MRCSASGSCVAVVLRGDRGLEQFIVISQFHHHVAVVLRGDRGLERLPEAGIVSSGERCGRPSGRSRIGTSCGFSKNYDLEIVAVVLRGDRGLEREGLRRVVYSAALLRSSFGAIEDWNQRWLTCII